MIFLKHKKIISFIVLISFVCLFCKESQQADKSEKESANRRAFELAKKYYIEGDYKKAFVLYSKLLEIFPHDCYISRMRTKTLEAMGYIDEAVENYEALIALNPDYKSAYKDLGFCYLLKGDFKKGYETHCAVGIDGSRGFKEGKSNFGRDATLYDGRTDIAGKTILVIDENGYGDFFQWIRYAKVIWQMGAKVVVKARKQLIPFLSSCPYIDKLISLETSFKDFDFQIYSGELYRVFKSDEKTIPNDVPYFYADEKLVEYWARALSDNKDFKIGICWEPKAYFCKSADTFFKQHRAAPLSVFYPLSKLKHVTLYSLQKVNGLDQFHSVPKDFKLLFFKGDFDKASGRFSDTAAVMKNLDLVITIDTSIAHLAGALGVPVWVILPKVPDWRWMLDRDDSPWYPTMRLFRQKVSGDWEPVMASIVENLKEIISI